MHLRRQRRNNVAGAGAATNDRDTVQDEDVRARDDDVRERDEEIRERDDVRARDEQVRARDEEIRERDAVRPRDVRGDEGIAAAHDRFGGIDIPASLVGMLTALATLALLSGLIGAALGAIGYQKGLDTDDVTAANVTEISIAGLIGGIVVLFLAYVIGGWAAGRIARYDGVRNGVMAGIWTVILAAIVSGLAAWLGDEYDVLRDVNMPNWFSQDALTVGAIVSGVAAILAMLIGGAVGGMWGERYHRRADAQIAWARGSGVERRERVVESRSGEETTARTR